MGRTAKQDLALAKQLDAKRDSTKDADKRFHLGKTIAALKFSAKKKMEREGKGQKRSPTAIKVKGSKEVAGQYQLPGFAEMIQAEIRLQVQDMVRAALQRGLTAQTEESEVTPIFKKA